MNRFSSSTAPTFRGRNRAMVMNSTTNLTHGGKNSNVDPRAHLQQQRVTNVFGLSVKLVSIVVCDRGRTSLIRIIRTA
jgi:hypothetical protein